MRYDEEDAAEVPPLNLQGDLAALSALKQVGAARAAAQRTAHQHSCPAKGGHGAVSAQAALVLRLCSASPHRSVL